MNLENLPSVVHRKLFKMFDACDLFFLSITFGNIKETIQKMNLDISDIAMDMTAKRKLFLLKIQCSSTGRQYLSFTTKIPNGTKRQKPVYLKIGDLTLKCRIFFPVQPEDPTVIFLNKKYGPILITSVIPYLCDLFDTQSVTYRLSYKKFKRFPTITTARGVVLQDKHITYKRVLTLLCRIKVTKFLLLPTLQRRPSVGYSPFSKCQICT
ncbi:F-box domain-containing protein [Caenorhabditis elegans]|uniref:F-box domain-containing protein n=1 Tax=Caenorhabditis elegans TaxID=6239 RepID=Q22777_CAEEL|nr:F-box domain-containing protein [Caenorhabditis elegans]CCD72695.2 F-box domain-containing protein [Caenorhabditis elegans]